MTTAEVLTDAGFDFGSELSDDAVESRPGPLSGSRGSRTSTGTARRRRASKTKLETLQVKLSQQMFMAGSMIGLGLPVTGYYCCQESDNFTKAVTQLASRRPEWVEALEHLADIQPGLIVGRTAIGLGASLAVDRGRADPEKQFMKFLGVTQAWLAVQNPGSEFEEGSAYVPPPASFTPV